MSTFMFKGSGSKYTPVSNIFLEKFMPKARGEFVKVYLLLLKYSCSGELGVNSSIIATSLNLLESDIMNAINYWSDEGIIKLVPVDKFGNFNIEFQDISEEATSDDGQLNLLEELNNSSNMDTMQEIEKLLGRTLSPIEMQKYLSWQKEYNFSPEMLIILIQYCISKGKTDYRYFERVAISWFDEGIKTIDDVQQYIKKHEDKWVKYRKILAYLGIKDAEMMKPQEQMLEKWIVTWGFSIEVIQKACDICFERLNRADFKYIDGILNSWNKDSLKTISEIKEKDIKKVSYPKKASNNLKQKGSFNNYEQRTYDYDSLERKLLGWDIDD